MNYIQNPLFPRYQPPTVERPHVKGAVRDPGLCCVLVVIIPSAKTIKTARRQRQEARSQKDFISLGRDGRSSAGSTPDRRRDSEHDDDDEPDDSERRIEFAPRSKSVRERIAEKLGRRKVLGE